MANQFRVEGISGNTDTCIAKEVGRGLPPADRRPHPHQGEVTRAAPEVANQNQLIAAQGRFVVMCRGNRLQFKLDRIISSQVKRVFEAIFSVAIIFVGFSTYEAYRSSNNRSRYRTSKHHRRFLAKVSGCARSLLNCVFSPKNFRTLQISIAQEGLQGLNQTAVVV